MYTVPFINKLLPSSVLYLLNMVLIIGFIGALDTWYGYRIWLVDELVFKIILFALQWWLLNQAVPLRIWLQVGILGTALMMALNNNIVEPYIAHEIAITLFPAIKYPFIPDTFYFISGLMYNTLIGIGVGVGQGLLLKETGYSPRWWSITTIVAYTLTTLWWYYYRILN